MPGRANTSTALLGFAAGALLIYAACIGIVFSGALLRRPDVLAGAITFDLTISVPGLFYLLVVRSRRLRPITLAPIVVFSVFAAAFVLPRDHQQYLGVVRLLTIPAELLSLGALVLRARQAAASFRQEHDRLAADSDDDFLERLRFTLREAFAGALPPVVAHAVAAEIAVLRYGLLWWTLGCSPATEDEAAAGRFSYHAKSGWGAIVGIVMFLGTVETTALHVWAVGAWGGRAAWLLSALGLYGLIGLWGDWQAARRRPLLLTGDALHVRIGLRWNAVIPLNEIARVQTIVRTSENARGRGPAFLRATLAGTPKILVTLHAPRVADGPFGIQKRFQVAGLAVDEPDAFVRALVEKLRAAQTEPAGTNALSKTDSQGNPHS